MKKTNRKGFTIVELVIVIAVIAILAAVLIPTFAGMIKKAEDSKLLQEATNALKAYIADNAANDEDVDLYIFVDGDTWFEVENGKLNKDPITAPTVTPPVAADGTNPAQPEKAGGYELVNTYESCKVYAAD